MQRLLTLGFLLASSLDAQQGTDAPPSRDLTGQFEAPDGLEVRLWAESPQLYNPTAIDVDARGRLWVTEAVNYRTWNGRNPGRRHPDGDRVVILEDSDGDGTCDRSKVFVQDPDLVAPLGICVLGRRVFVSCSPSIFLFVDDDGDDVPDRKEVFLTGFGGHDHDHGVHSLVVGPDGWLYGAAGNAGPHVVTDRAGFTIRAGSIYAGGGAERAQNRPGLVSDDGRAWIGGIIFRVRVDGTGLQVVAHNFRNEYEVALDAFGEMFTADNDDDGNRGCRTTWVMPGGNYGYFSADGSRSWQADRRPGQDTETAHWHQEDPGVMPAGTINGAGGPTGVTVYEGGLLPESFVGAVLNCDAGRSVVYAHHPQAAGAGFVLERDVFLASRKGDQMKRGHWFRPSDVAVGTDGAVYVSDWWDPGVGGHAAGDREAYGRILRIAPAGNRSKPPQLDLESTLGLCRALQSPAVDVRGTAWHRLARDKDARREVERVWRTQAGSWRDRSRAALWLAGNGASELLAKECLDPQRTDLPPGLPGILRVLRTTLAPRSLWVCSRLAPHAEDLGPAAQRELWLTLHDVRRALGATDFPTAAHLLIAKLVQDLDPDDRTLLEAFGLACEGEGLSSIMWFDLLGRLQPSHNPLDQPLDWSKRFARLAWRLSPQIRPFLTRAMAPSLDVEARREALTAIGLRPEREAAEAMLTIAQGGPTDLRPLASWWVRSNSEHRWREFGLAAQLGGSRADAELRWRSETMKSGRKEFDVAVGGARTVWLVVDPGASNSHDWADWIEPRFVTATGEVPVRLADCVSTAIEWGEVHDGRNCNGGPLSIDGETYARGLGTHAASEICLRVPDGATRLRATVGPDDGGTHQRGSRTELEFLVYTDQRKQPRTDLAAWRAQLLDANAPQATRTEAALHLARDAEGGLVLIGLAASGGLTEDVKAAVTPELHRNPDVAVRALASQHFPRADRPNTPSIPLILDRRGDRHRGQELFFSARAACATCHTYAGRGGEIGPELTAIAAKFDRTAVLDAVLNPSASIAVGYELWALETDDGPVYGSVLAEGENVVLKDAVGQRRVLPAASIHARRKLPTSLMPDSIALGLTAQELADLAAFLTHDAVATRRFGAAIDLLADGLERWVAHTADPNAPSADVWSFADGVLACAGRPPGYVRTTTDFTSYELSLEWRFPPGSQPGNSGVLLRMVGPDKVWPKSIEAQLQSGHAGDLWNIDAFPMQVSAVRTEGRRTEKLRASSERPIGEWNRCVITLDEGDLTLDVNGTVQNRASFCEVVPGKICLQSEGCAIEFRNVVLRPIAR